MIQVNVLSGSGLALAVALLLVGGCKNQDQLGRVLEVSAEEFAQAYSAASCGRDERCCEELVGVPGVVDDGCQAAVARTFAGAAAERYDANMGSLCVAAVKEAPCLLPGKHYTGPSMYNPEACQLAFAFGSAQPGEPCQHYSDCEQSEHGTQCRLSVCKVSVSVGLGESCIIPVNLPNLGLYGCAAGLFCSDDGVCEAPAKFGQACRTGPIYGDTCEDGTMCDRMGSKTCIKPRPVGAACDSIEQCENLGCVEGECRDPKAASQLSFCF